ncbi:galactoside alpha-(1,2)-fucosyltransferase 1-like [Paramacrobiotus metropolitanus]|uniref:galactoside alpha-(1,2)-fucosyltransferase 1-like n=1 Tax=Paramacrobiotus metropolitanus TaxID=2943436 RepID=UPI0024456B47|nr:galactoside alpha-(1,2)-fucosyltransferase 1-like [Paramacrobiotus metropolitanus]XP_055337363.1 galactoside alpha-(1,2)-fucosyltransferase 1-like [Paramacrobiotus metropolitanus]
MPHPDPPYGVQPTRMTSWTAQRIMIVVLIIILSVGFFALAPTLPTFSQFARHFSYRRSAPPWKDMNPNCASTEATAQEPDADMDRLRCGLLLRMSGRIAAAQQYRQQRRQAFPTVSNSTPSGASLARFLTYNFRPILDAGLGNFLFQTATLVGCAHHNHRIPVRISHDLRMVLFEGMDIDYMDPSVLFPNNSLAAQTLGDLGPGKFTPVFHNISSRFPHDAAALSGYGQSWKYFHGVAPEIRALLTLKEAIQRQAINAILEGLQSLRLRGTLSRGSHNQQPVRVGIHVRRGDIVNNAGFAAHGHVAATEEYLLRMALRMQRRYPHAVFFVLSNDLEYCRRLFREPNVVFVAGKPATVDLAVMTFMDVLVLSVGSYGWWAAYLSDAQEVVYFKDWPRNGSEFARGLAAEDYFLPAWHAEN